MKPSALLLAFALTAGAIHAAPFQNLGFDLANTNTLSVDSGVPLHGIGPAQDLLPGWELAKGGSPQSTLGLNLSLLSLGYGTLISADQGQYFGFAVDGSYALQLVGSAGNQDPFSLSQQGDVPSDAQVMSFRYSGYPFTASINGNTLSPLLQSNGSEQFNVSAFAGQTVNLTLTALGPAMPTEAGSSYIDSIAFAVPEPAPWTLLALACPMILWMAWHRRHRQPTNRSRK